MAMAFDAGPDFAFDKPANEPCRNLGADFACAIHAGRAKAGFGGCIAYDCLGAGQRVVQEFFEGQNWRDDPRTQNAMAATFRALREVHRLLELLDTAARMLPLTPDVETRRGALIERLHPPEGWTAEGLAGFDTHAAQREVQAFLAALAPAARAFGDRQNRNGAPA